MNDMAKRGRPNTKTQISVRIDNDIMARVDAYVKRTGMQRTTFMEQALALYVERVEIMPIKTQSFQVLASRLEADECHILRRMLGLILLAEGRDLEPGERCSAEAVFGVLESVVHWPNYEDLLASVSRRRGPGEE